jgi:hypothetical protein
MRILGSFGMTCNESRFGYHLNFRDAGVSQINMNMIGKYYDGELLIRD